MKEYSIVQEMIDKHLNSECDDPDCPGCRYDKRKAMITTKDMLEVETALMNTDEVKHGVDGWGLEVFSRDEEVRDGEVTVYGTYLYERRGERREVHRILDRRATNRHDTRPEEFE